MENKQNKIAVVFGLALLGAVAFYIYKDLNRPLASVSVPSNSLSVGKPGVVLDDKSSGQDYKIEVLDNKTDTTLITEPKMPDLSRQVVNYSQISPSSFENASKNIVDLVKGLEKEPKSRAKWIDLASFRKMLGDYEGSLEILNYIGVLWKNDYVIHNNLADLYQNYLKNHPLAEKNWLKVIDLKPDYEDAYVNLYDLYNELYPGQKGKALPILLKGLQNNPKSTYLMVYIARHYRALGDKNSAIIYYDKAVKEARAQNNLEAEESLRAEALEISQ